MLGVSLLIAAASYLFPVQSWWDGTTVVLPLGIVEGSIISTSDGISLPSPILAWFSIPFAAPPVGARRFQHPQPPLSWSVPIRGTDYGPVCLQPGDVWSKSEDCLTLSVFAPKGTKKGDKLPVLLWIPGGAFNVGGGRGMNVPSMVSNAPAPFIAVSINYRLGALGFLPSPLTASANLLNLGFSDQVASFEFVNRYIEAFGGDPSRVTLMGESAGAHSVGYHLLHVKEGGKRLFDQVIMDSGGPTARAFPDYNYPQYREQMKEFLEKVGCEKEKDSTGTFACLRKLDASDIMDVSVAMYQHYFPSMRWPFQPVVDYKYISGPAHKSWEAGAFQKVNILTGYNSDEGSVFAPQDMNTTAQFLAFFSRLVPTLTKSHLAEIARLYPAPEVAGSPYKDSKYSTQWARMSDAYADFAYIAQVQTTAIESSNWEIAGGTTYKYHFAQPSSDESPFGVTHASELPFVAVAGLTRSQDIDVAKKMNAYYTSYIITGDPNLLLPSSTPHWEPYTTTSQSQLRLTSSGTGTRMEKDDIRREACDFWRSIPGILQH